jgi:hypothetical protein
MASITLIGGPFDDEEVFLLPADTAAPAQIVWTGWFPWGFTAYLYEWRGERTNGGGVVYRFTGRQLPADDVPYSIGQAAESWVDATLLLASIRPLHPKLRFPQVPL